MSKIYKPKGSATSIIVDTVNNAQKEHLKKSLGEGYVELADLPEGSMDEQKSLGIVRSFATQTNYGKSTIITDIIDNKSVITISPKDAGVVYEEEVASGGARVIKIESDKDKLFHMGKKEYFIFNQPVQPGDQINNDPMNGTQIMVDPQSTVEHLGDGNYRARMMLSKDNDIFASESKKEWENQPFTIINNFRGEFDTNAAALGGLGSPTKRIKRLFRISDKQLIEISYSDDAGVVMMYDGGRKMDTSVFASQVSALKGKDFIIGELDAAGRSVNKVYGISAITSALVAKSLEFASNAIWLQRGVDYVGLNGKRVYAAPGLIHQIKNDCLNYEYNNDYTLLNRLIQASNTIFPGIPVEHRVLSIRGGLGYETRLKRLNQAYFLKSNMITLDQDAIPNRVLSGSDNMHLTYNPIGISKALLPGIGYVDFTHEPAFDAPTGNSSFRGTANMSEMTDNAVIMDARSDYDMAARASKMGIADKLVFKDEYKGSNIILVKDDGAPMIAFQSLKGRSQFGGEASHGRFEHTNSASVNRLAAKIVDPSVVIYFNKTN